MALITERVRISPSVQSGNLRLQTSATGPDDLDSLASVGIDDGSDLRFNRGDDADVKGGTIECRETVRKVSQVGQVAVDRLGD